MAISTHKLGPGQLTFGETGSEKEWGTAVVDCAVVPSANDGETITVLSGDEIVETGEETWTLEGEVYQSYDADSLAKWAHDHSGEEMPFTFRPNSNQPLTATGTVLVRSLKIGGKVTERNTSSFAFKCSGDVNLSAA